MQTTIRELTAGTRFTATSVTGRNVTLTVGEDVPNFPAVDIFTPEGRSGERAFVMGVEAGATFFADDVATIH